MAYDEIHSEINDILENVINITFLLIFTCYID